MRIIIDNKIPFIQGFAEKLGEAIYLPGADITPHDVKTADALIIRTRTRCNRQLLEGSRVKFIATATIGYDHLDTQYLKEAGISWTNCPGCNAKSVAQYVQNALLLLAIHGCWDKTRKFTSATAPVKPDDLDRSVFSRLTLGIVGVGHVGTQVKLMAERLGFKTILLCDPPRAEQEASLSEKEEDKGKEPQSLNTEQKARLLEEKNREENEAKQPSGNTYVTLDEIAQRADVITFHTPLTHQPTPHPTYHLAGDAFFRRVKRGAVLFNTSRGEVVSTEALKQALSEGRLSTAVIDTWEQEPHIDLDLLENVFLGTPHIAGYSADGKANGTRMALQAVARHFGMDAEQFNVVAPPALPVGFASYLPLDRTAAFCPELRLYNPLRDSQSLKIHPYIFEKLRGNYPLRREQSTL